MEYNIESFQIVRKTVDLQNHEVIVLGHFRGVFFLINPWKAMDFQLPQNVVCCTESEKPDLSAMLAKSLICQQNSIFFLGNMPSLCSKHNFFCSMP